MDYQSNSKIYGLQEGIIYGQNERVDEINTRLQSRYYPDSPLEPNFTPRPLSTKYSLFPVLGNHPVANEMHNPRPAHNVSQNFNPGTRNAPHLGYTNNINVETILRNQTRALQHGADQGVYVPSTNSDMYHVPIASSSTYGEQIFPDLFTPKQYNTYIPQSLEQSAIGKNKMFNHTRTQLRNNM
jgi:hypothetical protein